MQMFGYVGQSVLGVFIYTFRVFMMIYLSFRTTIFHAQQGFRTIAGVVASQVYFTGYQALPLVITIAAATGGVVILQASSQYNLLGGSAWIGQLMLVVVVREIGPLLTALIVIARSGTAVASEIGNMKANREIEALEVMGINPLSFIVFPRLVGGILSLICLALYFLLSAIFGGFLVARVFQQVAFNHYIDSIVQAFTFADVWLFGLKVFFSGAIIFTVACYQGLLVSAGSHEVPQVTTKAVVNSIVYVIGFNLCVTAIFYLSRLGFV